jgi:predicted  nucleic acid-binding Zn-ribbon protein
MEPDPRDDDGDLVRCLECGTIYSQSAVEPEVGACPNCGYVGWIVVTPEQRVPDKGD